ncbi:MAG TPA: thioredoxin family protein [Terriglobales bacterium]|nr:thioredoxin family protein [Terriglobales bacterium]
MCIVTRLLLTIVALATISAAQTPSVALNQWKDALLTGDPGSLRFLYSIDPAPRLLVPGGQATLQDDVTFWTGLKIVTVQFESLENREVKPGIEQDIFTAKLKTESGKDIYVSVQQVWQQQPAGWRLVVAQRTDAAHLAGAADKDLYPAGADAHAEIKEALAQAAKKHHRVLVVFGADWCYDCHVLNLAFHGDDLAPIIAKNYEVVHVDIGDGDKNQDLMKDYEVPMQKGIPAVAVLDPTGKLLFSQKNGEFEKARSLDPGTLRAFLNQWKPT